MHFYKVKQLSKTFSKAGLSPTVKNGIEQGNVSPNTRFAADLPLGVFESLEESNGWLHISSILMSTRWIQKANCEDYIVPDEPPPTQGTVLMQTRFARSFTPPPENAPIFDDWEEWSHPIK